MNKMTGAELLAKIHTPNAPSFGRARPGIKR